MRPEEVASNWATPFTFLLQLGHGVFSVERYGAHSTGNPKSSLQLASAVCLFLEPLPGKLQIGDLGGSPPVVPPLNGADLNP